MSLLAVCSTEIDWSATGAWFSGLATWAGVYFASRAMTTWKKQIRLQDRYQKTDTLLRSFILCLRAGHDWQWDCGVGENRATTSESEKLQLWRTALMEHRLAWELARSLFVEDECSTLTANPDQLQSAIIAAGGHLRDAPTGTSFFNKNMEELMTVGVREIIAYRNAG